MELTVAHIDGIDTCRSPLQEAIGKTPGGRAHIRRDAPLGVYAKGIQSLGQLKATTAHIGQPPADDQLHLLINLGAHFVDSSPTDEHLTSKDQPLGLLPALGQPTPMDEHI